MFHYVKMNLFRKDRKIYSHTSNNSVYVKLNDGEQIPLRKHKWMTVTIEKGFHKREELQTTEIFQRVLSHNPNGFYDPQLPGTLKLRDLRQLCFENIDFKGASIEIRRHCILLNLIHIRAIILHAKVIIIYRKQPLVVIKNGFLSHKKFPHKESLENSVQQEDLEDLIQSLTELTLSLNSTFFELSVLEALLLHVNRIFERDFTRLIHVTENLLEIPIQKLAAAHGLHRVYDLQRKTGNINEDVRSVGDAIQQLLNNDQDLRRVQLSLVCKNGNEWDAISNSNDCEELEMLLESYHQEITTMFRRGVRLDEILDDTLQLIDLHLASTRNTFLRCELALELVATVCSFVAAFTGLFGMNIPNGLESNPKIFWPIAYITIGATFFSIIASSIFFNRVKL